MKKTYALFALLLVVWLAIPLGSNAAVLEENFDDCLNSIPTNRGWTHQQGPNLNTGPWTGDSRGYNNTSCVVFPAAANYYEQYDILLSPQFTPTNEPLQLSFKYVNTTQFGLKIYVTSSGRDELQVLEPNLKSLNSNWEEATYSLNDFAGQTIMIAFKATADNGNYYIFLDDVVVGPQPDCSQAIDLTATAVTTSSATLSWQLADNGAQANSYILRVTNMATNTVVIDNQAITAPSKTHALSDLDGNTTYKVELTTDCKAQDKGLSNKVTITFKTLNPPVQVPFTEEFTALPWDGLSQVEGWTWYKYNDYSVQISDYEGKTSPASLMIQSNSEQGSMAVTPGIDHALDDLQFSAWVKGRQGFSFEIGVMQNPNNAGTYYRLMEYTFTKENQWEEIRYITSANPELAGQIGWSFAINNPAKGGNDIYSNITIDDIRIEQAPSCPRVDNVTTLTVDTTAATFSFFAYKPQAKFIALITPKDGQQTEQEVTTTAAGNIVTASVTKLVPATEYTIIFKAICGADDESEISLPVAIATPCGTRSEILFTEDFNNVEAGAIPQCWVTVKGDPFAQYEWEVKYSGDNNRYAQIANSGKKVATRLVTQPIYVDEAGKYDVQLLLRRIERGVDEASTAATYEGVRVYFNSDTSIAGLTPSEFIPVLYNEEPMEKNFGWSQYEFNIDRAGVVYIIIEAINEKAAIAIDDVKVVLAPECRAVKYPKLSEPTPTDATLSWRVMGTETQWKVKYTLNSVNGKVEKEETVNTASYKFAGLTNATRYTVTGTITAVCGGKEAAPCAFEFEFETECTAWNEFPFKQSFDNEVFVPVCWRQMQTYMGRGNNNLRDTAWVQNTNPQYIADGKGSARLRMGNPEARTALVSPRIAIPQTGDYRLTFYMNRDNRTTADGVVIVASKTRKIGEDAIAVADFYTPRSYEPKEVEDGMYKYFIDLKPEIRGDYYFVFEGVTEGGDVYIDEVAISKIEGCDYVKGTLSFDSIRHDAVLINIVGEKVEQYQVEYGEAGFEPGTETGKMEILKASHPLINGLQPSTDYDVYVRCYCDDANQSEWGQRPAHFSTLCSPVEVTEDMPLTDNFETLNVDETINGCYIHNFQELSATDKTINEVYFKGTGASLATNIYPKEGRRFASSPAGINTYVLRPVTLKKDTYYEISAYFIQDDPNNETGTKVAFVYGQSPKWDASMVTIRSKNVGNRWTLLRTYFEVPADGTYYVGWNVSQTSQSTFCGIDEFSLRQVACIPPITSMVNEIKSQSAKISWEAITDKWELKVLTTPEVETTDSSAVVYNKQVEVNKEVALTGLAANTTYYYYLRSTCGEKPSDWSEMAKFTTACDAVALGINEDFEDAAMADFTCWTTVSGRAVRDLTFAHSGKASLRTSQMFLITPELAVESLNGVKFSTYVYTLKDNVTVTIGAMTDPSNINTFWDLTTFTITRKNRWTEVVSTFNKLADPDYDEIKDAKYIVVQVMEDNVYFDDFTITYATTCPQPTEPKYTRIGGDQVDIAWTDNSSATSWHLEVSRGGKVAFDTVVTSNPATIVGLTPRKDYNMTIAAICHENEESAKTEFGTISTVCGGFAVPYKMPKVTEIWTELDCWTNGERNPETPFSSDDSKLKEMNAWLANTYGGYEGNGQYEYNYHGSEDVDVSYAYLEAPEFNLKGVNSASLVIATDISEDYESVEIYATANGSERELLATHTPTDNWDKKTYDLSKYKDTYLTISIKAHVNGTITEQWASANIIYFEVKADESCTRPTDLYAYSTNAESISGWFSDNNNSTWQMSYGLQGIDPDAGTIAQCGNNFSISGLTGSTIYDVYVRAVCSNTEKSLWVGPATVTTGCPAITPLPYHDGMETYNNFYDACFDKITEGQDQPSIGINTQDILPGLIKEGNRSLLFDPSAFKPIFLTLPKFDADYDDITIEFSYKYDYISGEGYPELRVGLMVPGNANSFQTLYRLPITDKWKDVSYRTLGVAEQYKGYQLAFCVDKGYWDRIGIDDINVFVDNSCPKPAKFETTAVGIDNANLKVAIYTSQFELAYGLAGTAPDNCTAQTYENPEQGADVAVNLTGLDKATPYYVFVRGICENEKSEWSSPLVFTTECDIINITEATPYEENFDAYEEMGVPFPPCFTVITESKVDETTYPLLNNSNRISEPRSLMLQGINMVALPEMNVPLHQTIISFDAMGHGYFRIGLVNSLDGIAEWNKVSYLKMDGNEDISVKDDNFRHYEFDMTMYTIEGNYFVLETREKPFSPTVYFDNIKVEIAPTCYEPRGLKVSNLLDTAMTVNWLGAPDATIYEYKLETMSITEREVGGRIIRDTVFNSVANGETNNPTATIRQLTPNTKYRFSTRTICEYEEEVVEPTEPTVEKKTTHWSTIFVTTLKEFGRIPYECDFEEPIENSYWYRTGSMEDVGYNDWNRFVMDTARLAVYKGERALYVSAAPGSAKWEYSPSDDRLYLIYAYRTFYLEPGNYDVSYMWKSPSTSDNSYARMFIVSDTMQFDREVYHRNDGQVYYKELLPEGAIVLDNGKMNNQADWAECLKAFSITKADKYKLVVGWAHKQPGSGEDALRPIAIDNLTMENHALEAPINLHLTEAGSTTASFEWECENANSFRVRVRDANGEYIYNEIVEDKTVKIEDLAYASSYRIEVRAEVKSEEDGRLYTSKYTMLDFLTECVIPTLPYSEDFNALKVPAIPVCWNSTPEAAWKTLFFNGSNVMNCELETMTDSAAIITPAFTIDADNYNITFAYYNNSDIDLMKLYANVDGEGFNTLLLQDSKTVGFEERWIDLSKYNGKQVAFAFTVNSKDNQANRRISIDNFRIGCMDKDVVVVDQAEICSSGTYEKNGFVITPDMIADGGVKTFDRLVKAPTADVCDHIERLVLTVGIASIDTVYEEICKGKGYISEAFPVSEVYPNGRTETGKYINDQLKNMAGCDSTVVLFLTVKDMGATLNVDICEGSSYEFNGENLTESGTYTHEGKTQDGECDSVTTLNLTVLPKEYVTTEYYCEGDVYTYEGKEYTESNRFEVKHQNHLGCDSNYVFEFIVTPSETVTNVEICQGQSYIFDGEEIRETTTRQKQYRTIHGCDSLSIVNVTVTAALVDKRNDIVCQGSLYTGNGWYDEVVTEDVVLTRIEKDVEGCETVIELHLDFIETIEMDIEAEIKQGEKYPFGDRDLTTAGKYDYTFQSETTGCDSIVHLTLTVTTGVDDATMMSLTLAPNPIRRGDVTYVHRDWTAAERDGLRVEVLNSVGQVITTEFPEVYPIVINAINNSGVYYIRITTGTGDAYIGKLIIK